MPVVGRRCHHGVSPEAVGGLNGDVVVQDLAEEEAADVSAVEPERGDGIGF